MTQQEEQNGEFNVAAEHAAMVHEKHLRCLELRKAGYSYDQIARTVGYKSRRSAFRAVTRLLDGVAEEPTSCVRKIEMERLSSLMSALWPKAEQGDLEAIDRVLAIHQRICAISGIEGTMPRQFVEVPGAAPAAANADELVNELLDETSGGAQARSSPAKAAPTKTAPAAAPARTAPQEKAAPPKARPEAALAEALRRVPVKYWVTLGVLSLILAIVWGFGSRGIPTPDQLARTALTAPDKTDRVDAAAALSMIKQPDPTVLLRQLAEKTNDPEVLVQVLNGLTVRGDNASLPTFIGALEHADAMVRAAAWVGVQQFYSNKLPEDLEYQPDAPAEERTRVARRLKAIRDELMAKIPKNAKV